LKYVIIELSNCEREQGSGHHGEVFPTWQRDWRGLSHPSPSRTG